MTELNRRDFLKVSAVTGAATVFAAGCASAPAPELNGLDAADAPKDTGPRGKMALYMDNSLCVNCQACRLACQNENNLPVEKKYIRFDYVDVGSFPTTKHYVNRHSCQHCTDAPCVDVCPVDALYKGPEGFTHMEFDTCIGCQACGMVCPFSVPDFGADPASGEWKMYKCTACKHLVSQGGTPACASTCMTEAVQYGPWDEMLAKAESRVAQLRERFPQAEAYGATQQDGLGLILVLRTPAADYPHLI